ncbi:MAG: hypothetical protein C0593_06975 [Marinilabiliales bacterium]|nr:MAG: hypothetical protein C0593_06975 [Marinilabiliales bacterium]
MKWAATLLLLLPFYTLAQDIHFSDILQNKIFLDPSVTAIPANSNTAGIIYRNQGRSITTPYKTYGLWYSSALNPKFLRKDKMGIALAASHDGAGDGNLQQTRINLCGSFAKSLMADRLYVSLGYGIGITNRSIDFSKLTFASQWNGHTFDPSAPQNEPYQNSSIFYMDMMAGISALYRISNQISVEGGVALDHISEPKETFYVDRNQLGRKIFTYSNMRIAMEKIVYSPGVAFISQSGNREFLLGSDVTILISEVYIGAGLWYRWNSDIIPSMMIMMNNLELSFSYDANVGIMHPASKYRGGMEVSLIVSMNHKKRGKYDCEEVEF